MRPPGPVVDELGVDVYAFGLITDFRGPLFDGTRRMLEIADERVEMQVETRRWCGAGHAQCPSGQRRAHVHEGETVVVGDTEPEGDTPLFGDVVRYERRPPPLPTATPGLPRVRPG